MKTELNQHGFRKNQDLNAGTHFNKRSESGKPNEAEKGH
jgi:hypothetical protein